MNAQILDFSHPAPRARVEQKPPPPEVYDDGIDGDMAEFRRLAALPASERRARIQAMIDTNGASEGMFTYNDPSERFRDRIGEHVEPDTVADTEWPWWVWLIAYCVTLGTCLAVVILSA
jgi:hypothetical protein